ncbi:MAG TPA: glycosyltransferase family 2 protein [Spirochaetota bacterium]|nr:glycosyltransferase family 2 protein [Spirochaetota bacterium]HPC39458.1 glycosyltransferase family 2 protein [Spirochaetota bacterium]HPL15878.1 glycosyltransferase family 2 protein [Spirochaetota bacterium]HQF06795.1 glycosyltransferase family 2 protein [Spirochaetota bacterium]HQH95586.1 glycosyltransferase family 2 protein [Spirochaetota bacterium]
MESKQLIIIPVYNQCKQIIQNLPLLEDIRGDILMIDDGSTDTTYSIIKEHEWLKYIKHEQNLGIGAAIITGCEYARDLGYDIAIILNLNDNKFKAEIQELMDNINYGYDIVNSSRILENYEYADIPQEYISLTSDLSSQIRDFTGFDITDPLSGILAIRLEALKEMELTEFNHSLLLQLWIQAHYFGLSIIEIPAQSGIGFGEELTLYDDPMGLFLSLMEAEKILYPKKNIN